MLRGEAKKIYKKSYLPAKPLMVLRKDFVKGNMLLIDNKINKIVQSNGYKLTFNQKRHKYFLNIMEITGNQYNVIGIRVGDRPETIEKRLLERKFEKMDPNRINLMFQGRTYAYKLKNIVLVFEAMGELVNRIVIITI